MEVCGRLEVQTHALLSLILGGNELTLSPVALPHTGLSPDTHCVNVPRSQSGTHKEENIISLPEIEPRLLDRTSCSLVLIRTQLSSCLLE
jgi:hypothetical protein